MNVSTFLAIVAVLWLALALLRGGRLPGPLGRRTCQGAAWRAAFPQTPKAQIRATLALFGDAFAIDPAQRLKLRPDDQLLCIYRLYYPRRWQGWQPDNLEFETLHATALRQHGVDLQPLWDDGFTLADLLRALHPPVSKAPAVDSALPHPAVSA